jgi:hypothetical protein
MIDLPQECSALTGGSPAMSRGLSNVVLDKSDKAIPRSRRTRSLSSAPNQPAEMHPCMSR